MPTEPDFVPEDARTDQAQELAGKPMAGAGSPLSLLLAVAGTIPACTLTEVRAGDRDLRDSEIAPSQEREI